MELIFVIGGLIAGAAVLFWFRSRATRSADNRLPPPAEPARKHGQPEVVPKPAAAAAAPGAEARGSEVIGPESGTPAEPIEAPTPTPTDNSRGAEDLAALRKGLKTTRGGFVARLAKVFAKKKEIDPALLEEIEEILITADIGVRTVQRMLESLREKLERKELSDADRVWDAIRQHAFEILSHPGTSSKGPGHPKVVLVVGVNGVGKTTTIGKLASKFKEEGQRVLLAAGDTFRAAAVLQLEVWGRRVSCDVVKGKERADPGSVIFDAIRRAQQESADLVLADTAGRLHTKMPLMDELKKVYRTVEKALEGNPPDEVLLVLDSTNGQNAIQQVQMFKEALPLTGIALTKLDGTAKGGVILGIVDEHQIPVRYIGIGERVEDLREFDAARFVEALFEKPDDESLAA